MIVGLSIVALVVAFWHVLDFHMDFTTTLLPVVESEEIMYAFLTDP